MKDKNMKIWSSISVYTLIFIFLLSIIPINVSAWSNGGYSSNVADPDYGTHDWIAGAALDIQTKNATFIRNNMAKFRLGTETPDNPKYIGDTTKHHIYFSADYVMTDDSAAKRANEAFNSAISNLKNKNYAEASYYVGVMSHYISDVGVFGHLMGSSTSWGSETHHSDYEEKINNIIMPMALPVQTPGNKSAYNATQSLGYSITFGAGVIKSCVWMDDNYNWSDKSFRDSTNASIIASVGAVAAAINNLLSVAPVAIPEFHDLVIPIVLIAIMFFIFDSRKLSKR